MTYTPRDYQQDGINRVREQIMQVGAVCFVCPTGSGKTVTAAFICRSALTKNTPVLILVHRQELLEQTVATLSKVIPADQIGTHAAGYPACAGQPIVVAMAQTMAARVGLDDPLTCRIMDRTRLLIIDECHHVRAATWEEIIGLMPDTPRIGLTATPIRGDGQGLAPWFNSLVVGPSIPELVEAGHLAPSRVLSAEPTEPGGAPTPDSVVEVYNGSTVTGSGRSCSPTASPTPAPSPTCSAMRASPPSISTGPPPGGNGRPP